MKRVTKEPCFWIALVSFIIVIIIAVVSSAQSPGIAVLNKLEKGINKRKPDMVIACFKPEVQAELKVLGALSDDLFDLFDFSDAGEINILYGDIVTDEHDELSVQTIVLINNDGICSEAAYEVIDMEEVDGKRYLSVY